MGRTPVDERIKKVEEQIAKEELNIETSREKIRKLKEELNVLNSEKEKTFMNDIIKLMKSKGISHDDVFNMINSNKTAETGNINSSPMENK